MKELHPQIKINASAKRVWQLLTDFASYPHWNPLIRRISGEPTIGERLQVRLEPPESRDITLRPKVLTAEPNHQLRWLEHLFVPGLFDGEHFFAIQSLGQDWVRQERSLPGFARSPVCPQPG
jgi:hypothetical protein